MACITLSRHFCLPVGFTSCDFYIYTIRLIRNLNQCLVKNCQLEYLTVTNLISGVTVQFRGLRGPRIGRLKPLTHGGLIVKVPEMWSSGLGKIGEEAIVFLFASCGFQKGDRVSIPGLGGGRAPAPAIVCLCKVPPGLSSLSPDHSC